MLLPEAVALAETVDEVCVQVRTSEEAVLTEGVPLSAETVAAPVAVQPLLWVTVTV